MRRIFPALVLVLASALAFGWLALLADEYTQLGKPVIGGTVFLSNFMLWKEVGYFDSLAETKPLLHLWSLAVEEQFYIIWPLTLWFAWKRNISLLAVTLAVAFVSLGLNVWYIQTEPVATFFWPVGRFWELLSGSVLAWLMLYKTELITSAKQSIDRHLQNVLRRVGLGTKQPSIANLLSLCGLLVLAYGVTQIHDGLDFPGTWAMVPVLGALLVIAAGSTAWLNRELLMNPVAIWFGLISYPLYLWHWPVLSFLRIVEGQTPGRDAVLVGVLLSILLAWPTYKLVEKPIRFASRYWFASTATLCFLMTILGGVGYFTYSHGGLPGRSTISEIQVQADDLKFRIKKKNGEICDRLLAGPRCYYEKEDVSAVIIGDSHAPPIYSGLKDVYARQGKNLAVIGGGAGCPPLLNVVSKLNSGDDTRNCIEKLTNSLLKVLEDESIEEIIFASRGPLYTTSSDFGEFGSDRFGEWVLHFEDQQQGSMKNSEVFEIALDHTFVAVLQAGKRATFLYDVPELGFDIKRCAYSRPFSS